MFSFHDNWYQLIETILTQLTPDGILNLILLHYFGTQYLLMSSLFNFFDLLCIADSFLMPYQVKLLSERQSSDT